MRIFQNWKTLIYSFKKPNKPLTELRENHHESHNRMLKTKERKNIKVVGSNKKRHILFKKEIIRQRADF